MTGHIRPRGNKTWEIKFDIGTDPLTGRRITKYRSFKGTKREAQVELTRLKDTANRGNFLDLSKLTLGDFLDQWDRDWATPLNITPKTRERYLDILRLYVKPYLGAAQLQKLRPSNFAELYSTLGSVGGAKGRALSPRSVGHVHRVLHRALGYAVTMGLVTTNPVEPLSPPKVQSAEIEILSEAQVREVLGKLRGHALYPIVTLALATGMRRGELVGLRWKDVSLDAARLRVEQSIEQTRAGLRVKSPKTTHGRRSVTLAASVVTELRAHWKAQQELRLKLGQGKAPDGALVFPALDGGPLHPDQLSDDWRRAVRVLKLPKVTFHGLRHTHASQLIAAGLDVLTISRRLGHGAPTITLGVYGHLFTNTDDRAAQVIEAAMGKALTE